VYLPADHYVKRGLTDEVRNLSNKESALVDFEIEDKLYLVS
jgi:hypothetical protein